MIQKHASKEKIEYIEHSTGPGKHLCQAYFMGHHFEACELLSPSPVSVCSFSLQRPASASWRSRRSLIRCSSSCSVSGHLIQRRPTRRRLLHRSAATTRPLCQYLRNSQKWDQHLSKRCALNNPISSSLETKTWRRKSDHDNGYTESQSVVCIKRSEGHNMRRNP